MHMVTSGRTERESYWLQRSSRTGSPQDEDRKRVNWILTFQPHRVTSGPRKLLDLNVPTAHGHLRTKREKELLDLNVPAAQGHLRTKRERERELLDLNVPTVHHHLKTKRERELLDLNVSGSPQDQERKRVIGS